jgi:hypothetical protein
MKHGQLHQPDQSCLLQDEPEEEKNHSNVKTMMMLPQEQKRAKHSFWRVGLTERLFISRYSTSSTESLVCSAISRIGIVRFSDDRLQVDKAVTELSLRELPRNGFHQAKNVDLFK